MVDTNRVMRLSIGGSDPVMVSVTPVPIEALRAEPVLAGPLVAASEGPELDVKPPSMWERWRFQQHLKGGI